VSGEVIHERVRPGSGIESAYLGLNFPATDIPPVTREMLRLNGVLFIADISAPGVPVDLFHERVTAVDLSMSVLRAPAECHVRYLQNMGVKSSLVVAIIVDGSLWGLYSFHSYTTVVAPSTEERIMVEMAATITSSLVSNYEREKSTRSNLSLSRTLENLDHHTCVHKFMAAEHETLKSILEVDSIVLCQILQPVSTYGNKDVSLTPKECRHLLDETGSAHTVLYTSLGAREVAFFSVCWLLVAFLRKRSMVRHVRWTGKPDAPLNDPEKSHPRASFETFMQLAEGKPEPWSELSTDLLSTMRLGVSSFLFAEVLPAGVQEVFAQVSHELRTPFHSVMGWLEILRTGRADMSVAETDEIIDAAILSGTSMMSTLDNIIDIAKDRDNSEVTLGRFIASRPIHMIMLSMQQYATMKMVELTTSFSTESTEPPASTTGTMPTEDGDSTNLQEVIGDERRIKHIVAVKFTPGRGKVQTSLLGFDSWQDVTEWWKEEKVRFRSNSWLGKSLSTGSEEDAAASGAGSGSESGLESGSESGSVPGASSSSRRTRRWYVYCVEDTGVGIGEGDLWHLMKVYRQVSRGPRKSFQGIGLGLHICKTHVEVMLGGLGVTSTLADQGSEGKGGTFVTATAVSAIVGAPSVCGNGGDGDNTITGPGKNIAFLVVDDHESNVKLMEKKLGMLFKHSGDGVRVLTANAGLMALEVLAATRNRESKSNSSNVEGERVTSVLVGVFMDFHMPNMDRIECTRRIRQLEAERGWER
ncbi:unnamed protein product, partial [Pylaiella littoralis]